MTPLAFELFNDLTTPHSPNLPDETVRKLLWRTAMSAHYFDVCAVQPLVEDIANKLMVAYEQTHRFQRRYAFLPAPLTWLEFKVEDERAAILLSAVGDASAETTVLARSINGVWNAVHSVIPNSPIYGMPLMQLVGGDDPSITDGRACRPHFWNYAALALINTPRIIGRRQHMPHERTEREQIKKLGLVGKFPLHAWTEIVLSVAPPDNRTGEPAEEGHLTGEKCLHFCRSHLRVRLGQIEYVDSHWRGNPALGIKQSRYRLENRHGV